MSPEFESPLPDTSALFEGMPDALRSVPAVTVMSAQLITVASASLRRHVCVAIMQVQLQPESAVIARPGGGVSGTITVPIDAEFGTFDLVVLYTRIGSIVTRIREIITNRD